VNRLIISSEAKSHETCLLITLQVDDSVPAHHSGTYSAYDDRHAFLLQNSIARETQTLTEGPLTSLARNIETYLDDLDRLTIAPYLNEKVGVNNHSSS
jgi:hypothetical protein